LSTVLVNNSVASSNVLDQYVVIGNPIAHSKSPSIHAAFAEQTRQQLAYQRLMAPLESFVQTVETFRASGGKGANVTVPFKLEAYALANQPANQLTPRAAAAGAVNTLKFEVDHLIGDNTDGIGLVADIMNNAGVPLCGKRVLLLGAGGAARGAILPLLEQQPASLWIANRTLSKAQDLRAIAQQFSPSSVVEVATFEQLSGPFDVIINATSASLSDDVPPLPTGIMTSATLAYDMMYAATPTAFLRLAHEWGAVCRDGLGMLVEQAAEAFYLWRGVRPQTEPVLRTLRTELQAIKPV